ncbi:MAG: hypothetical protein ACOX6P_00165 [Candidatus Merdivicinus sp.]|jgi:hypothetical protein
MENFFQASLLDELSQRSQCYYLSDLKYKGNGKEILEFLEKTEVNEYPVHEWIDAWQYFVGNLSCTTASEARVGLIAYWKGRMDGYRIQFHL